MLVGDIHLLNFTPVGEIHVLNFAPVGGIHVLNFAPVELRAWCSGFYFFDSVINFLTLFHLNILPMALLQSVSTTEPAMCLLAVPNGFVFGTDQFYFVGVEEPELIARPLMVPGCPPDWHLVVLLISENELLLACHSMSSSFPVVLVFRLKPVTSFLA